MLISLTGARHKMVNKIDSIPVLLEFSYMWKFYELRIISKLIDSWFELEVGILIVPTEMAF